MNTVNDHAPDIMTQVTDLLSIFLEAFADGIGREDTADSEAQGLALYTNQIEQIGMTAEANADLGLAHVCKHYQTILLALSSSQELGEEVRLALEEWPTLVMAYLETPTDPDIGIMLLEHLRNPVWPTPLLDAEATALQGLLCPLVPAMTAETMLPTELPVPTEDVVSEPPMELPPSADALELWIPATPFAESDMAYSGTDALADMPEAALPDPEEAVLPMAETGLDMVDSTPLLDMTGLFDTDLPTIQIDLANMAVDDSEGWQATGHDVVSSDMDVFSDPPAAELPDTEEAALPITDTVLSTIDSAGAEMTDLLDSDLPAMPTEPEDFVQDDNEGLPTAETTWFDSADLARTAAADVAESTAAPEIVQARLPEDSFAPVASAILFNELVEAPPEAAEIALTAANDDRMEDIGDTLLTTAEAAAWHHDGDAGDEAAPAEAAEWSYAEDTGDDEAMAMEAMPPLDATAQSLVALLIQEIFQIQETLATALQQADTDTEEWRQVLADYAEDLERFSDGAESLGLEGVKQSLTYFHANLLYCITQDEPLSAVHQQMLIAWPTFLQQYLQQLHDPTTHMALVQSLCDRRWPEPLSATDGVALQAALLVADLHIEDAEPMPERQREAHVDDLSLTLPEDVNAELLGTLLQELPQQAADFSAAIQRLTTGTGTLADVDVAQRIAHSLKGAANTVGVPGVANLTHHLEDILLAFAQQGVLPTSALSLTLTSAADCLEAMSETLCGVGAPPAQEEMLQVFQEVLDWANLIDTEGVPSDDTLVPPLHASVASASQVPTPPVDAESLPAESLAPASTTPSAAGTRMSADIVDEMLRLTGESMILNGQLQNRLGRTMQQSRGVRGQNMILQQLLWDLEQLVDVRGITSPLLQRTTEGEFDPLEMEQYNELHTVSRRLLEAVTDVLTMGRDVESSLAALDGLLHEQRRVQRESEETAMRTRMVPVHTIAPRLQRGVRQACRLTGKDVTLTLQGGDTLIDNTVLNALLDPLMHILRNAVDHGIEDPEQREALGKAGTGTITLTFAREGSTIVVRCRDDGAGLDYAAIRRTAIARGLLTAEQSLSEEELGRLILRAGFSTRTQTTQVSGRGIGMDVVYSKIQELKGTLHLSSVSQQGCQMELRLPVSLMSAHGLLVQSGRQVFAVSSLGIEQILYPGAGALIEDAATMRYRLGDEDFAVTTLEAILNVSSGHNTVPLRQRPLLLVRDATGQRQVVLVQAILDSQTLVIKNLGRYIPTIKGLVGATILGDGSAAAVLDLPDLLSSATQRMVRASDEQEDSDLESTLPVALVVDDSLSARRALADFMHDLGFEVHTAGDGLDAIASIERKSPDILLVDLEMPRMNGLELAAHVRTRPDIASVPIIMITSRSTEKHRRSAAQSGVDVYLVKPFPEDALAEHVHQLTTARQAA